MKHPRRFTRQHLAERVYALWLHLYPRAHRDAYGALMLQMFRDMYRDALAKRGRVGISLWLWVAADGAKSLLREYGATLQQRRQQLGRPTRVLAYSTLLLSGAFIYIAACPR